MLMRSNEYTTATGNSTSQTPHSPSIIFFVKGLANKPQASFFCERTCNQTTSIICLPLYLRKTSYPKLPNHKWELTKKTAQGRLQNM